MAQYGRKMIIRMFLGAVELTIALFEGFVAFDNTNFETTVCDETTTSGGV